jgi:hypothetical protein
LSSPRPETLRTAGQMAPPKSVPCTGCSGAQAQRLPGQPLPQASAPCAQRTVGLCVTPGCWLGSPRSPPPSRLSHSCQGALVAPPSCQPSPHRGPGPGPASPRAQKHPLAACGSRSPRVKPSFQKQQRLVTFFR